MCTKSTHTHTHLLRTAFRIVEVECILRAKQQRHLKSSTVAKLSSECLKVWLIWLKKQQVEKQIVEVGMVVLGLATSHPARLLQVGRDDQSRYPPNS